MSNTNSTQSLFALIGASGYVAPRHMKAIQDSGSQLVAAMDPFDSVGVMDNYFPDADFFVEFERFDRHLEKLKRQNKKIDYISVCSPNYLHDAHIRFGLRYDADVICEKPLVLNPWNLDALEEIENESGRKIYSILQMRLHPSAIALKKLVDQGPSEKVYDVDLSYITTRGHWYYTSWKGQDEKSGGIATNIGIHFFDLLSWIFGSVRQNKVHISSHDRAAGYLELEKARVRWFLSINGDLLPKNQIAAGEKTYRSLKMNGQEFEFSGGFSELHSKSYQDILANKGFGIQETRPSIQTVYEIRNAETLGLVGDFHPLAKYPLTKHPFHR